MKNAKGPATLLRISDNQIIVLLVAGVFTMFTASWFNAQSSENISNSMARELQANPESEMKAIRLADLGEAN